MRGQSVIVGLLVYSSNSLRGRTPRVRLVVDLYSLVVDFVVQLDVQRIHN